MQGYYSESGAQYEEPKVPRSEEKVEANEGVEKEKKVEKEAVKI